MGNFLELRKERGLSQFELARQLNIDQTTVSKWEKGKALPYSRMLLRLSKLFDVSIDYLLGNSTYYYPDRVALKLSEMEQQLVVYFRRLPGQTQDYIFGIVQNLAVNL